MNVKVTVNGVTFEGDKDTVKELLENVGYVQKGTQYYYSKSRGMLPISQMHTSHIMNAALKMYREWVADLSKESDPKTLYRKVLRGPTDPAFSNLLIEMAKRDEPKSNEIKW